MLSTLEYSQGLTQALPLGCVCVCHVRMRAASLTLLCSIRQDKSSMSEAGMSLMQLPHMDANNVKKLNRSKIRRARFAPDTCTPAADAGMLQDPV